MAKVEVAIFNLTKQGIPSKKILKKIVLYSLKLLKKKGDVSLVFIDNRLSRKLNNYWRKKNKPTTVLSFSQNSKWPFQEAYLGDIFLNLELIKKQARQLKINSLAYLTRLIIHGTIHLVGLEHKTNKENKKFMSLEEAIYQKIIKQIA